MNSIKVLMVHNYYRSKSPSGENIVFKYEIELLKRHGHKVIIYERNNDEILNSGVLRRSLSTFDMVWSLKTYKELKYLIQKERPDIAHFHNIWYLISPSGYYACKELQVPVVQTIHNFRMLCANGLLFRNGKICEKCVGKYPWRGVIYRCYNQSRLYSSPIVFAEMAHKLMTTWDKYVDCYIALTKFARNILIRHGFQNDKIVIKPNFVFRPFESLNNNKNFVLFFGRLSQEKGIDVLIKAFEYLNKINRDVPLRIIGDGPLKREIIYRIKKIGNIELLSQRSHAEILEQIKDALFVIIPSICYEMFPMTVIESYSMGKPVIASRIGSLSELVEDNITGLLFDPNDFISLASKIFFLYDNKELCYKMGSNAKIKYEKEYTPDVNITKLYDIYEKTLNKYFI